MLLVTYNNLDNDLRSRYFKDVGDVNTFIRQSNVDVESVTPVLKTTNNYIIDGRFI